MRFKKMLKTKNLNLFSTKLQFNYNISKVQGAQIKDEMSWRVGVLSVEPTHPHVGPSSSTSTVSPSGNPLTWPRGPTVATHKQSQRGSQVYSFISPFLFLATTQRGRVNASLRSLSVLALPLRCPYTNIFLLQPLPSFSSLYSILSLSTFINNFKFTPLLSTFYKFTLSHYIFFLGFKVLNFLNSILLYNFFVFLKSVLTLNLCILLDKLFFFLLFIEYGIIIKRKEISQFKVNIQTKNQLRSLKYKNKIKLFKLESKSQEDRLCMCPLV